MAEITDGLGSTDIQAAELREAKYHLRTLVDFISNTGLLIADNQADEAYRKAHAFLARTDRTGSGSGRQS